MYTGIAVLRANGGSLLELLDHVWSSTDAANTRFAPPSTAKMVSSTGATWLSVQVRSGSASWCGGGPLANTNEQPANHIAIPGAIQRIIWL
jgi:hypothetical protein